MASKLKRTKKARTHKVSPNTAGPARGYAQKKREVNNKELSRTPWQKAKAKRFHSPDRIAKRNIYLKKAAKSA